MTLSLLFHHCIFEKKLIKMTTLEQRFADVLCSAVGQLPPREAVEKLMNAGFIDIVACERQAIYEAVQRAERDGMRRCEALEAVAVEFCCSYEKARNAFYKQLKSHN